MKHRNDPTEPAPAKKTANGLDGNLNARISSMTAAIDTGMHSIFFPSRPPAKKKND
jgi:hypothetical protein